MAKVKAKKRCYSKGTPATDAKKAAEKVAGLQDFATAMYNARVKKGWTQKEAATAAGMFSSNYNATEWGKRGAGSEVRARICKALGLRVKDWVVSDVRLQP